jgi:serine/threonine protein kinase
MELVEGPTLADRITEGAIPLEEALAIARQVADGLEAAHDNRTEAGIPQAILSFAKTFLLGCGAFIEMVKPSEFWDFDDGAAIPNGTLDRTLLL